MRLNVYIVRGQYLEDGFFVVAAQNEQDPITWRRVVERYGAEEADVFQIPGVQYDGRPGYLAADFGTFTALEAQP